MPRHPEPDRTDVCVVGAGPAGSAIAARLAVLGHEVTVVEARRFPRPHVGICLSDESEPVLAELGVGDAVRAAGFHRRRASRVRWESAAGVLVPNRGLHVDRGAFDSILLENALRHGVTLLAPVRVTRATRGAAGWRLDLAAASGPRSLECRFLVDAAGRSRVVGGERRRSGPPLFALHADWSVGGPPVHDGSIEALDDAWCWLAQTSPDTALVSVFVDPAALAGRSGWTLEELYRGLVGTAALATDHQLGTMTTPVRVCDASTHHVAEPVGPDFLCVGDACLTVDPLASQGVHLAMASAISGAIVVDTLLRWPAHREDALAFYRAQQQERVRRFRARTAEAYGRVAARTSFWRDRAGAPETVRPAPPPLQDLSQPVVLSSLAEIRRIAVLEDDRIVAGPALVHPGLERPLAWLGGVRILELVGELDRPLRASELVARWFRHLPADVAAQALRHLWSAGVLEPAANPSPASSGAG